MYRRQNRDGGPSGRHSDPMAELGLGVGFGLAVGWALVHSGTGLPPERRRSSSVVVEITFSSRTLNGVGLKQGYWPMTKRGCGEQAAKKRGLRMRQVSQILQGVGKRTPCLTGDLLHPNYFQRQPLGQG